METRRAKKSRSLASQMGVSAGGLQVCASPPVVREEKVPHGRDRNCILPSLLHARALQRDPLTTGSPADGHLVPKRGYPRYGTKTKDTGLHTPAHPCPQHTQRDGLCQGNLGANARQPSTPGEQQQNFWSAQGRLRHETAAREQKAEAQPGCASFRVNAGHRNPQSVMHFIQQIEVRNKSLLIYIYIVSLALLSTAVSLLLL